MTLEDFGSLQYRNGNSGYLFYWKMKDALIVCFVIFHFCIVFTILSSALWAVVVLGSSSAGVRCGYICQWCSFAKVCSSISWQILPSQLWIINFNEIVVTSKCFKALNEISIRFRWRGASNCVLHCKRRLNNNKKKKKMYNVHIVKHYAWIGGANIGCETLWVSWYVLILLQTVDGAH